jgi:arylsulfatase A-like enzyme
MSIHPAPPIRICRWIAPLLGLWISLLGSGCSDSGSALPRNVILISIDTLRPDHLGAYGYSRPTSPSLDALASGGILFEDASTPSPWTLPAHASLLTGRYPSRHGLKSHDERLPAEIATVAEVLQVNGFATAAFVNSHNLSDRYGHPRRCE